MHVRENPASVDDPLNLFVFINSKPEAGKKEQYSRAKMTNWTEMRKGGPSELTLQIEKNTRNQLKELGDKHYLAAIKTLTA